MNDPRPYVGVNWFKQAKKWRAYVAVPGARVLKEGVWTRPQRFVYVGLYDNPHIAALAREARISQNESLSRATRNLVPAQWHLEYDNLTRDPDVSLLEPYTPNKAEDWYEIPGYGFLYEVSTMGRVRATRTWGQAIVKQNLGTVILSKNGLIQAHRVAKLVQQAVKSS